MSPCHNRITKSVARHSKTLASQTTKSRTGESGSTKEKVHTHSSKLTSLTDKSRTGDSSKPSTKVKEKVQTPGPISMAAEKSLKESSGKDG